MNILQMGPFSDRFNDALAAKHSVRQIWAADNKDAFVDACANDIDMVVTSARFGLRKEVLARLPKLKAVCSFGVGYDTIDVAALKELGIPLSNTPDVLTECVADMALALMLAAARRIPQGDKWVRDGRWGKETMPLARSVSRKRLGILGLGRIGMAIAQRGRGFDMEVAYTGARPSSRALDGYRFEPSLKALAEWADFLVIACVGGPTTHHIVSREVLEALGTKGTVVNIARGTVIDEAALLEVLGEGKLGAAGLDVLEHEPKVPPALLGFDNVVLQPHMASATVETRRRMEDLLWDNIEAYVQAGKVLTPV